ncbi:hypothetical protein M422DRAFT_200937 [Sphaerobolus stellatus SS14]|nr:hypothetical protein M422DRAFT_200937 [Sphaerobolus stellatus SS14]
MYRWASKYLGRSATTCRMKSTLSDSQRHDITSWLANKIRTVPIEQPTLFDHLNPSQVKALALTLPTLDGSNVLPEHRHFDYKKGSLLAPGHLLAFCNPSVPERELDTDGTTRVLPPPDPFVRRMWASGSFEFRKPLYVGDDIRADIRITKIEPKRLDTQPPVNPMIIVEQTIATFPADAPENKATRIEDAHTIETRAHVYMPLTNERRVRPVRGLPHYDFSFSYTPTDTTLFRFSALTFNAHRIHLDKEYSRNVEDLPERLVHGPMTAMMLLEVAESYKPKDLQISKFTYRATNQLYVNDQITIHGAYVGNNEMTLWAESDNGVVGMVGDISLVPSSFPASK